jgi:mannitol-specific phosphotransferase system IIBC component
LVYHNAKQSLKCECKADRIVCHKNWCHGIWRRYSGEMVTTTFSLNVPCPSLKKRKEKKRKEKKRKEKKRKEKKRKEKKRKEKKRKENKRKEK